jgi:TetR/AcrR family transcriptional regulator, mexJK operon transcriptional repressor
VAADHFNWLVMSAPVNRAMLLGRDEAPAPAELDRWAVEGVRTFLAAFGRSADSHSAPAPAP